MSDYTLDITIHDLDGAVQDAVETAHRKYEPKFYDWMKAEIESNVDDKVFHAIREKMGDSDNANTEQHIGVNEVESIVDEAVRNAVDDLDFEMLVRDYGNVGDVIEDYIYNNDIVDKCWVEDELSKVHRDIRDEVLSDIRDEIGNTEALTNDVATLQAQIMGMQAEIDFLHEKYQDIYNRSLRGRVANAWDSITLICRRIVRRIPRITITKGGA